MALQKLTLTIRRGATNVVPIRLEQDAWSYANISAVSQTAPLRITADDVPPDNWRAAIMNVKVVGDFEAQSTWYAGLASEACLRVMTLPAEGGKMRLVIDIAH